MCKWRCMNCGLESRVLPIERVGRVDKERRDKENRKGKVQGLLSYGGTLPRSFCKSMRNF